MEDDKEECRCCRRRRRRGLGWIGGIIRRGRKVKSRRLVAMAFRLCCFLFRHGKMADVTRQLFLV